MADETLAVFRAKYGAIDKRLDAGLADAERNTVKGEIVGLFKSVEAQIADLSALRDEIKQLVDKFKSQAAAATLAPQFTGEKPVVHADHIGASTFIEKGWSRLSLGDHEGAEQALLKAIELSPGDPQSEALLGWAQMLQEKYDDALMNFQKVLVREPANSLARINVGFICLKKRIFGEARRSSISRRRSVSTMTARRHSTRTSISGSCTSSARCTRMPSPSSRRRWCSGRT